MSFNAPVGKMASESKICPIHASSLYKICRYNENLHRLTRIS